MLETNTVLVAGRAFVGLTHETMEAAFCRASRPTLHLRPNWSQIANEPALRAAEDARHDFPAAAAIGPVGIARAEFGDDFPANGPGDAGQ